MFQNVLRKEVHWWILCRFRADKTHFPRINIMVSFVIRDFQLRNTLLRKLEAREER